MRVLLFNTFNFAPSFLGVMLNEIQEAIDQGHEVFYVTCSRSFEKCGFNFGYRYACGICEYRLKIGLPEISGNFMHLKLAELIDRQDPEIEDYMGGVKDVEWDQYFENFDVGESVLSSYISKTRDRDITLPELAGFRVDLIRNSLYVYKGVKRFLQQQKIDRVVVFNGRWDYYRATFRAAQSLSIPVTIKESLRSGGYIENFENTFPHDIEVKHRKMSEHWDHSPLPEGEKKKIAEEFFTRKRGGQAVVDRSYNTRMKKAHLPEGIDLNRKIIVVYNNSDDEYAAIGKDYRNLLFGNQAEGIYFLAQTVGEKFPDYQLVVRMHPNLSNLEFAYVKEVLALKGRYPNVIIAEPESQVDSYTLLDLAWKVVTFGSSIGVEASYWGKPVILLAKQYYWKSDVAYVPSSLEEIEQWLAADLPSKPQVNALKVGYYFLTGGVKAKYYDCDLRKWHTFKGKALDTLPFFRKNYYRVLKRLYVRN